MIEGKTSFLITIRSDLGERATSNCTRVLEKNDSQIRCCRNDRHCWLKPADADRSFKISERIGRQIGARCAFYSC
jgi:hypothetical protein